MLLSSEIRPRNSYQKSKVGKGVPNKNPENQQASGTNVLSEDTSNVSCGENLHQYLLNSTLHGLRYVGETHISVFERVFFFLSFILVVCLSVYFISNIYQKWTASPIIIGLNPVATSISEIPFPAVTICNMNIARKSLVETIQPNTLEQALMESLCQEDDELTEEESMRTSNFSGKWRTFRKFLLDVSQPCSDMLIYCRFATQTEKCMELFNTVLSDDGLCCTFNSVHPMFLYQNYDPTDEFELVNDYGKLSASDWTPEGGWPNNEYLTSYPRPASGSGSHLGLFVVLNASIDDYYCSSTNSKGFKILLHNPTETPKITDYGFSVTTGKETRVVITPRISDAALHIRSVPTVQRQCIFANEGNLTYFRTYSRKNCEMECESRIIEEYCGCVQYFMPRTNRETKICSRKDYGCYGPVNLAIDLALNASFQCSCLPGCFEIYYKPAMYTSTLGNGEYSMRDKFLNAIPDQLNSSVSVVHIYYEESFFRSYTKEELIGFTEFLSSTGGLLGLFMGFSMVSLIEIIYFISLRPYCALRRFNQKQAHIQKPNEPRFLRGVTDPKHTSDIGITLVRPVSIIAEHRFAATKDVDNVNAVTWRKGISYMDRYERHVKARPEVKREVERLESTRYPYTE